MTGFGRSEGISGPWKFQWEMRSVNHRFLEFSLRLPEEFRIGYREVQGPAGEWFLAAHLGLETGDSEAAQAEIRRLLAQRAVRHVGPQPQDHNPD